jgi:diguanylate cyclase (GGDEF)-like protein/hemerythrin-like metal-binding protein
MMDGIINALDALSVPAFIIDVNHMVVAWNSACSHLTGIPAKDILGTNRHWEAFYKEPRPCLADMVLDGTVEHISEHYVQFGRVEFAPDAYKAERFFEEMNGARRHLVFEARPLTDHGEVTGAIEIFHDITELREAEAQISFLAHHDQLTNLPNRRLLEDRISQMAVRSQRTGEKFAVAVLDIDQLRVVNEALGHDVGDLLLKEAASRLVASVRASDSVGRLGGDVFAILITGVNDPLDVAQIAAKMQGHLGEPYVMNGRQLSFSGSLGLCMYPSDGTAADELIKNATAAMYRAKESGRNTFKFFTHGHNAKVLEELTLTSYLKAAIPGQLFVQYQPQLSLLTRAPLGVEALVRWRHPEIGLIGPDRFIPMAESAGLIREIGAWVLERSCDMIKRTGIKTAVNLSPLQMTHEDIVATVEQACAGIDPGLLTLEITEGAFVRDFKRTRHVMEALQRIGVGIALDDFGTGYSSLTYLRHLPVDYLKIDQSFIRDRASRPIVQAIINLADNLCMSTIAEGVEAPEQIAFLERQGCTAVQGFFYARPMDEDKMVQFIREQPAPQAHPSRRRKSPEPVLSWSFTFSTGVAEIDSQHKHLIMLINRLHSGSMQARKLRSVAADMIDYANHHFGYEESQMVKYGAPGTAEHILEHDGFRRMAAEFRQHMDTAASPSEARKMAMYLGEWLVNHILRVDKLLGQDICAKQSAAPPGDHPSP